jgi:hypothetical protein
MIKLEAMQFGGFVLSEAVHEDGALIEQKLQACSTIADLRRALDDHVSEWHRVLTELEKREREDVARPVVMPEDMPRIARQQEAEKPRPFLRRIMGGRS